MAAALCRDASKVEAATLNGLSTHWRSALASAGDAVHASAQCALSSLPPAEVHQRATKLARERNSVATLLEETAHDEHVRLLRSINALLTSKSDVGLPAAIEACLFDLDGVLTTSDAAHFDAWAETFDEFLARRFEGASVHLSHYARFSRRVDYDENIRGRVRLDGVRAFLASRGITVPEGSPGDAPGTETVNGLANRKNEALRRRLERQGVIAYAGAHHYLETAASAGVACVVISASANTEAILEHAGLADLIDGRIDGATMRARSLLPKPEPDTILAACDLLGLHPAETAAFETTPAGVVAAKTAGCGLIIGVDRTGDAPALLAAGAEKVVSDLGALLRVSADRAATVRR